jgi:cell division protein FtsW (lipid II flippase)
MRLNPKHLHQRCAPAQVQVSEIRNLKSEDTRPWRPAGWWATAFSSLAVERLLLILAAMFVATGFALLAILARLPFTTGCASFVIWAASFTATHVLLNRFLPGRDPLLLPVTALLSGWGLIEIARLAPPFLNKQIVWLPISIVALLTVTAAPRDLRWLKRYRYTWLFAGLLLLGATLVLGVNPSGASVERLWLRFGPLFLQPSEILKLLFVAYLSSYLAEKRELITTTGPQVGRFRLPALPYLAPLLVMWGLAMLLLASQQDIGAALLFFFTFLAMLYIASGQAGYVIGGLGLFLIGAGAAYWLISRVALRVDIWWNPWVEASGRAFQIVQSLIALGTGGILGQGLGQGAPTVIPVVHSDFVYAAIGEEFGLMGTLAVMVLFGVLMLRGFRAAMRASAPFARLLGAGLATLMGLQAWVIMAGNAKLIPLTGVTLPFLSYGGSSLLASFVAIGLLLQVSERLPSNE